MDREIAIASMLYGLGSALRFNVRSEPQDSPISSRMAGLWQSSLFLARQGPSPDQNISWRRQARSCSLIAGFFRAHKNLAIGITSHCRLIPRPSTLWCLHMPILDHTGWLPVLVKDGYRGPIFANPATIDLTGLLAEGFSASSGRRRAACKDGQAQQSRSSRTALCDGRRRSRVEVTETRATHRWFRHKPGVSCHRV